MDILNMKKRIITLMVIFTIMILALFLRLGYVQIIKGDEISFLAEQLWSRDIPIEGQRGNIYDRNNKLIVGNTLAPSVAVIPKQIKDKDKTATFLSNTLETDRNDILEHLNKNVSIEQIKPAGQKIDVEQAEKILEENLEGVYVVNDTVRYYPYGEALAHTLGFTGIDNQGIAGLEYIYDDYLMGDSGAMKLFTDAKGNNMNNNYGFFQSPEKGYDMHLTIDLDIQMVLERVLENAVSQYNPDGIWGLVTNTKTGEVLSMASYPSFNPNEYQDYDQEVYNRNLPIWMSYEPGSVFKIVTYAAGLEEGAFDFDDRFYDKGYSIVDGVRINDWKAGGHGDQNFLEVIQNSCNPGFIEIGQRLGVDTLFNYIDKFGFGKKTGIDLLGESSGIIFNKDLVGPIELATSAFGQGNSTTPIQLVNASSAAVNGGNLMTPYILDKFTKDNEVMYQSKPIIQDQVISVETSNKVAFALENVVANGSGRNSFLEGYRVGGKTGTAQKVGEDGKYLDNNYILSFLGMAPMNDPELSVYIAIDNPKNTIQYGGVVAAPLVKNVLQEALPLMGVEKQPQAQIDKEYRYYIDTPYFAVENYVNTEVSKIHNNIYSNYQIKIIGNGNRVISQIPSANEKIAQGQTVLLYTY